MPTWQASKKWVAKDDKQKEAKTEEAKPAKGAKGESKGGKKDKTKTPKEEKAPAETQATSKQVAKAPPPPSMVDEPFTGPTHSLIALLRIRSKADIDDDKRSSWFGGLVSSMVGGGSTETSELKERPYTLEVRPVAVEEEKVPGARRAARDAKRAERKASEENIDGTVEPTTTAEVPPTPTSLKIDLEKEIQDSPKHEAPTPMASQASYDFYNTYLASMQMQYYTAAQMQQWQMQNVNSGATTVMLRNIPNRYSREKLVERLDIDYKGKFDFVYLPIDFSSKCNMGYAFINFVLPKDAQRFITAYHGQNCKTCLPGFSSNKVCEVSYARVQGKEQNVENLKDEKFMTKLNEQSDWQPLVWENGEQVPFEKLLGDSTGRKRSGSRKSMDMSPMTGGGQPSFFPPYVNPYGYYPAPPATEDAEDTGIKLQALVGSASEAQTMMLRNIPKVFSREEVLQVVDKDFKGDYDFFYLPMDPKAEGQKENRGFAFINFREGEKGAAFKKKFNEVSSTEILPTKDGTTITDPDGKIPVCEVVPAKLDSLNNLLTRFNEKALEDPPIPVEWYPLLFDADKNSVDFPTRAAGSSTDKKGKKKKEAEAPGRTANAKSKAKAKAKPKGKQQQQPFYPGMGGMGYYGGYPYGYTGFSYANAAQHSAQLAQALAYQNVVHQQQMAFQAQQQGNMLDQLGAAVQPGGDGSVKDPKQVRKQIEYYFSLNNLCKDTFLRSHMNEDGWVPLQVLSDFPKVKQQNVNIKKIAEVLTNSDVLEVKDKQVRLKDEETRKLWGPVPKMS